MKMLATALPKIFLSIRSYVSNIYFWSLKLAIHISLMSAKPKDLGGASKQQMSGKKIIRQLDFNVPDPLVLKGARPPPEEYASG